MFEIIPKNVWMWEIRLKKSALHMHKKVIVKNELFRHLEMRWKMFNCGVNGTSLRAG